MKLISRRLLLVPLIALLVTAIALVLRPALWSLDAALYDAGLSTRPTKQPADIAILGIDENFMAGLHPYLTPRSRLARLISAVASGKPKVIVVDVSLDARIDNSPQGQDAQLRAAFLAAKAQGVPVVLTDLSPNGTSNRSLNGTTTTQRLPTLPYFASAVNSTGTVIFDADPDNAVRRFPQPPPPKSLPFLPAKVAQLASGKPVSFEARTPLEFWGPPGTVRITPAIDIVKQPFFASLLEGKIVFIGATYPLSYDYFDSPYSLRTKTRPFYGIELLAQATQTLLDGAPYRPFDSPSARLWEAVFVFLVALGCICVARLGIWQGLGFAVILFLGSWVVAFQSARDVTHLAMWGYHFHPASPFFLAIPLATGLGLAWRQWEQARELRLVRDSFSAYVGDEILAELGGKMPELGGEIRPIAVLFCDIRGYSALAETMRDDPKGLLNELNEHFQPLVGALKERGAYVDNYVGDLVMALFNAPVNRGGLEQAAQKAVLAALDFVQVVEERNAARRAAGKPAIEIGVGVHCGDAVVGNLGALEEGGGSKIHYTAIGDTVNIASRVESTTRKYDATLLVTEETVHACGEQFAGQRFVWEFVAETTVKGRIAPVRLYQVRAESL